MIAQFRYQHEELVELAEGILSAAIERHAANLSRLRLLFARAVTKHCSEEGAVMRDAVASGTLNADIAGKHNHIVMMWRAEVALCNSEWPTNRIVATPAGFLQRFRPLVQGLRAEVELEDVEVLTVLEGAQKAAA